MEGNSSKSLRLNQLTLTVKSDRPDDELQNTTKSSPSETLTLSSLIPEFPAHSCMLLLPHALLLLVAQRIRAECFVWTTLLPVESNHDYGLQCLAFIFI